MTLGDPGAMRGDTGHLCGRLKLEGANGSLQLVLLQAGIISAMLGTLFAPNFHFLPGQWAPACQGAARGE